MVHDEESFYVHGKSVKYCKTAFGLLDNKNKLRWAFVWVVTSKWFDNLVLILIVINSIILGVKDYTDPTDQTPKNKFIVIIEPVFTYSFLMECIFKVIA